MYVMNSENLKRIVKLKPDLHLFLLLYLRLHLKAHPVWALYRCGEKLY